MFFRQRLKSVLSPATLAVAVVSALLIAVIWIMALLQLRTERAQAFDAELAKNNNLAQSHDERVQRSLQLLDQIVLFVRADHLAREMSSEVLRARLASLKVDRSYVEAVAVIGADGALVATTSEMRQVNFADRDYFKLHSSELTDSLRIGPPILGRLTDRWAIPLTRSITLPDGRFGGVVYLALDPAFLANGYQNAERLQNGSLALIGLDGITRMRRNGDKLSFGDNASASQLFQEIPKAAVGNYIGIAASDGERRLVSYRVIEAYPMVTVVASSLRDLDAASGQRERLYQGAAAASTLLIAALAGLSIWMLLRRKRTLAAIEDSERRYRMLFEGSLDAVLITRADDRVISANPAACRLLGLTPEALSALCMTALFDPGDARAALLLQQVRAEGVAHGQVRMLRADGTSLEVEVSATSAFDSDHFYSMIVRDITDRKRAEDQIKTLAFYDPLTSLPNRRLLLDR
ncbi:MAG: PAS domain S-box protein, partial [Burkholderiaceae bacterium]|nr:PAS domain S-box protein [Burkholderiaceae bacterium]